MRHAVAFLFAPLWVPLFVVLYAAGAPGPGPPHAVWLVLMAAIGALFAYVGMVVIGIPTYLFLLWRNWTALWPAVAFGFVAGFIMGNLFAFVFFAVFRGWSKAVDAMLHASLTDHLVTLVFAAIGMLVAGTAWLIIRPDRENASQ
jgi:hypothetical protein